MVDSKFESATAKVVNPQKPLLSYSHYFSALSSPN